MVWTKSKASVSEMMRSEFAMEWTLKRRASRERVASENHVAFVYRGKLPSRIPKTWVAWEPEVAFAAVPWDSRQNAAEGVESWWWRGDLGLDAARSTVKGAGIIPHEVIVGVVDSGVQTDHPWLAQSFRIKTSEIPGNGLDDDGNGLVDDVFGYDFVDEDSVPEDLFGHGTHVAGLLAARDPGTGEPVGLNVNTRLVVARALNRYGKSNSIDLSRAVVYLTREGVDIMNCSWGGGSSTQALRDAFAFAVRSGVLVFSSAGNDRIDTDKSPQVPKMFPGVIPIGAFTQSGKLAAFSNWGAKSVQWMAPGDKILSTLPSSQIGEKSGTSMASPIAVNLASWIWGILLSRFPDAPREYLYKSLLQSVCSTAASNGVEGKSTCGRIRGVEATQAVLAL
jgi:subtilisin family serine protease